MPTMQFRIPSITALMQPVHPVTMASQQFAMELVIPDITFPMVAPGALEALLL